MNFNDDMEKKTFLEHFTELRSRLIQIIFIYIAAFSISYYFAEELYFFAAKPLIEILGSQTRFIYTGLTEAFFTYLNLAAKSAFVIILPVIIFHLYKFIAPGLYKQEKNMFRFLSISSPILFILGILFVYNFVMPKAFEFLLTFQQNGSGGEYSLNLEAKINEYISLFTSLLLSFGIAFQLPIFILLLVFMNIIKAENLSKNRRFAIILIFIIAGIITPPDVMSQLFLAFPLMGLYEITIIIAKRMELRRKNYA